jgi:hypothetical protein
MEIKERRFTEWVEKEADQTSHKDVTPHDVGGSCMRPILQESEALINKQNM